MTTRPREVRAAARAARPRRRARAAPEGEPLSVVHVSAEYWPLARTGGLGEAVAGLAAEQATTGIRTAAVLPLYRSVRETGVRLHPLGDPFEVRVGPHREPARLWQLASASGPRVVLVESHDLFGRHGIYGEAGADYADNARRFAFLSLAALHALPQLASGPAVLHAHDWHAALAVAYLRTDFADRPPYAGTAAIVSVHNAGFQGHFPPETLPDIGIAPALYDPGHFEWYGRANLLKGGLSFADAVITVSPTHARELCTDVGGFGLDGVFRALGDRLVGIRNGINQTIWDPGTDPMLVAHYGVGDLAGKVGCKAAVQQRWGLPVRADVPLVAMSSRLVTQKGIDLLVDGGFLAGHAAQFAFLGEGEHRFESALRQLVAGSPERVAAEFAFTDEREHVLLAGADLLLMPSLYEPCGLTQMRGQRYGTLPVARRVGGLADTIEDERTGFLFEEYTPAAFQAALRRALQRYAEPEVWRALQREAMERDWCWAEPARQYAEVYRRALARA